MPKSLASFYCQKEKDFLTFLAKTRVIQKRYFRLDFLRFLPTLSYSRMKEELHWEVEVEWRTGGRFSAL
ncbi:hypothetical protein LEP1GSC060_1454 [Leptospira weilii serovar Ranarum str. ICFT]|uniref:Uncharacterized protein n=1 Tax=Leptospira weilii serovar Ranarum str. ICFT TaxID=1218598 RepID=N1WB90_9LEPT|nr:hypothetical protein LEP1GSC060_1454 [Leptospira weilii serovar Ranarum str. ICFT]